MTLAIVKVLPLPVTPRRISRVAPRSKPRQMASIASGWSPMGAKGADRRKPAGPPARSFSKRVSTYFTPMRWAKRISSSPRPRATASVTRSTVPRKTVFQPSEAQKR